MPRRVARTVLRGDRRGNSPVLPDRAWCAKFGQAYANGLRRRRPRPGDKWHLDDVVVKIKLHDPLPVPCGRPARQRARRVGAAAPKRVGRQAVLPQSSLKGLRYVPRVIVTDKLRSYAVAHREVMASVEHRQSRVPEQSGGELPSADQAPGAGDETLRLSLGRRNGSCLPSATSERTFGPAVI